MKDKISKETISNIIQCITWTLIITTIASTCIMIFYYENKKEEKLLNNYQEFPIYSIPLNENKNDFIIYTTPELDEYYINIDVGNGEELIKLKANNVSIITINNKDAYIIGHFNENKKHYIASNIIFHSEEYVEQISHYTLYVPENYIFKQLPDTNYSISTESYLFW